MKRKNVNKFPPGLDEQKVRKIIDHYDNQTEEEFIVELEAFDRRANELRRQNILKRKLTKFWSKRLMSFANLANQAE